MSGRKREGKTSTAVGDSEENEKDVLEGLLRKDANGRREDVANKLNY